MDILNILPPELQHEVFSYVDIYENERKKVNIELLKKFVLLEDLQMLITCVVEDIYINEITEREDEDEDEDEDENNPCIYCISSSIFNQCEDDEKYSLLYKSPFIKIIKEKLLEEIQDDIEYNLEDEEYVNWIIRRNRRGY